jgi:hypothetical protein
VILGQAGRVYHAAGDSDLQQTRPIYCYVPDQFFDGENFQKASYLTSRWPSINCSANPLAVGSHVIPNPKLPVDPQCPCPILSEFLQRLEQIAAVKTLFTK